MLGFVFAVAGDRPREDYLEQRRQRDGVNTSWFIEMGDHLDGMSNAPVHTATLGAFYMDVHEVTVGQFREFVNQSGYKYGGNWDTVAKQSPGDEYPMIYVNRHNFQVTTT